MWLVSEMKAGHLLRQSSVAVCLFRHRVMVCLPVCPTLWGMKHTDCRICSVVWIQEHKTQWFSFFMSNRLEKENTEARWSCGSEQVQRMVYTWWGSDWWNISTVLRLLVTLKCWPSSPKLPAFLQRQQKRQDTFTVYLVPAGEKWRKKTPTHTDK